MTSLVVHHISKLAIHPTERTVFCQAVANFELQLAAIAEHHGEALIVLSTCERFEVYSLESCRAVKAALSSFFLAEYGSVRKVGEDAIHHLFRVASGLDSRLPGEAHVLGQVKLALNQAVNAGRAAAPLRDIFGCALRCGRLVRMRTGLGTVSSDYVDQTLAFLAREWPDKSSKSIGVVGTGALARSIVSALARHEHLHTVMLGRHQERTMRIAKSLGVAWRNLSDLESNTFNFDALIVAVSSSTPVVFPSMFSARSTSSFSSQNRSLPLFIDLGIAPAIHPDVARLPQARVVRLDDLGCANTNLIPIEIVEHAERAVLQDVKRFLLSRSSSKLQKHSTSSKQTRGNDKETSLQGVLRMKVAS